MYSTDRSIPLLEVFGLPFFKNQLFINTRTGEKIRLEKDLMALHKHDFIYADRGVDSTKAEAICFGDYFVPIESQQSVSYVSPPSPEISESKPDSRPNLLKPTIINLTKQRVKLLDGSDNVICILEPCENFETKETSEWSTEYGLLIKNIIGYQVSFNGKPLPAPQDDVFYIADYVQAERMGRSDVLSLNHSHPRRIFEDNEYGEDGNWDEDGYYSLVRYPEKPNLLEQKER
jgi:hypothetical protein